MKFLSEYRDAGVVEQYLEAIHKLVTRPWSIMEVCGGQTHSLVKNGILQLLPKEINMIHGPGCPVCVTPVEIIDKAIWLADSGVVVCSFGDMLRVPGSKGSLLEAKARGADIRILYSPLEAVQIAAQNPDKQVVFFAVGFETTAPANALSVLMAQKQGLHNYSILASHVLVPPAIEAIMDDPESRVNGFLAAGHVCTIMGISEYYPLVEKYRVPIVVTGFEPADLLQGIYMTVKQLEDGRAELENQYARMVREEGNPAAKDTISQVFEVTDRMWRGLDVIPQSGYKVKPDLAEYDAEDKFEIPAGNPVDNAECIAGEIMKGIKKPFDCPNFGTKCKPENPLGAPMVSSEGACAAYYHFSGITLPEEQLK
ncbi:MAG: hydrogenase formation protein HypD [Saprospiraceae bacterium]|nr:hydrogenase formation protein HypD [Saprospiraceae bacterium]